MPILWSKEWSASDDGTIVRAVDIQNLQDDIDASVGDATKLHTYDVEIPEAGDDGYVLYWDHTASKYDYKEVFELVGNQTAAGNKTFSDAVAMATSLTLATGPAVTGFVDEDDMSSDSATLVPTQQSVKAYVDATGVEVFTSSSSWTAPTGVTRIILYMVGGGGASGSNKNSASGGGGGGGACVLGVPVNVTPASSYTYTVGAGGTSGGAGSASTSPDGNDGADSVWDTGGLVITASGGSGGIGYGTPGVDGDGGAGGTGNSDMDGSGATGGSRYTAWSGGQGGGGRTADSNGAGGGATYFSDGPDKNVAVVANTGVGGASPTGNQGAGQAGSDGVIIIIY